MESIVVVVLVRGDLVLGAVNNKAAVLDAIRVSAWHASEMWVERIYRVMACIVESENNITLNAIRIIDEKIGY